MVDLYSMIEAGGRMKFEVTAEDLVTFAEKLIAMTIEMRDAETANTSAENETYLSCTETAEKCQVSKTTLWSWEKCGYLVPVRVGKRKMYPLSVVNKLLTGAKGNIKTMKKMAYVE